MRENATNKRSVSEEGIPRICPREGLSWCHHPPPPRLTRGYLISSPLVPSQTLGSPSPFYYLVLTEISLKSSKHFASKASKLRPSAACTDSINHPVVLRLVEERRLLPYRYSLFPRSSIEITAPPSRARYKKPRGVVSLIPSLEKGNFYHSLVRPISVKCVYCCFVFVLLCFVVKGDFQNDQPNVIEATACDVARSYEFPACGMACTTTRCSILLCKKTRPRRW